MKLFIERVGLVLCASMAVSIPIGFIVLTDYLYKLHESQGLNILEIIIAWIASIVWFLIFAVVAIGVLAGMFSDLLKLFKWLFIEPFTKK